MSSTDNAQKPPRQAKPAAGIEFEFVETYSQLFCESCPLKVSKSGARNELNRQKPTSARKFWKQAQ
jgi:hypothetical protein